MSLFEPRNAFADIEGCATVLKDERGPERRAPLATIVVPTYQRFDTLVETVRSALTQDSEIDYEVIIVDNDPSSEIWPLLTEALPAHFDCRLAYYVNEFNLGMLGNWNCGIELARAPWVTILHDDDILKSAFLRRSFEVLARIPK